MHFLILTFDLKALYMNTFNIFFMILNLCYVY